MNRELPREHEIWQHFKGEYYQIICIGHHSETKEQMVVYQRLPSNIIDSLMQIFSEQPCIRPLEMFMSEVDHDKYPDAKQKYRFERF